ncbi:MAG: Hpt domain-containing protein [Treponema sp.]|nr:Hpt domain-containing protein [Treponema sp.]MCL2252269.1 Hpt domain-containing protein [Treponema sp.]
MADEVTYINVAEGINRVMKNTKLFSKLLGKFKDDTNIKDIESAFEKNDIESARNSSHTLKGLAANLALTELFKQVLELETQLKAGTMNRAQLAVVKNVLTMTNLEIDKVIEQYA